MQTQQRKIPVGGNDGKMKTWIELLPVYKQELEIFKQRLDSLKSPYTVKAEKKKITFSNADVTVNDNDEGYYSIRTGSGLFSDTATYIKDYAAELNALNAVKLNKTKQLTQGTIVRFSNPKPVKVLVGYFDSKDPRFLQPPQLEIDASANNYAQAEAKIRNAILVSGLPPVNIHTYTFKAGDNTLTLAKGIALVLGFIDEDALIQVRDAGLVPGGVKKELDWLFE
jgi:hypothetical protein